MAFGLIAKEPDLTLAAVVARLASERSVATSDSSVDRFFKRCGISFKKSLRAAEQDRPDVAAARYAWKASQASFDPRKLVFIDETGANTKMVRSHGRSRRGRRLLSKAPWGHWKTTTFTAGLRHDGLTAPSCSTGRGTDEPSAPMSSRSSPHLGRGRHRGARQPAGPQGQGRAADAFTDDRTGQVYFSATIEIPAAELVRLPSAALYPGMPVDVAIVTGQRTLLAYLVQPLVDSMAHTFREE